jgi:hypothetical protein
MQHRLLVTLSLLSLCTLAACNDESTGVGGNATVRFANATNTPLDVATAGIVATGNGNVAFGGSSACTVLSADQPDFEVRQAGTSTALSAATYAPSFTGGNTYLVVAYPGFSGSTQYATVGTSVAPAAGQAGLRVVNLAPGSGIYDVYVSAPGAALGTSSATGIGFGTTSGVISVTPGSQLIRLTNTGTQTVAINAGNQTFTAGQSGVLVIAPAAPGTTALRSFFVTGC